jgi:hypothetical protein
MIGQPDAYLSPIPVDELDPKLNGAVQNHPQWVVECGRGCEVGIIVDDRCFVVLAKTRTGGWAPTTHIPNEAVFKLAQLAEDWL